MCTLPWLFPLLCFDAHPRAASDLTAERAERHTLISLQPYTPVSPVKSNQIEWLSSGKRGCLAPLSLNSAPSNECVQCEVAGACTISLCNYVTRSKNQDVFSSASLSLVHFDILPLSTFHIKFGWHMSVPFFLFYSLSSGIHLFFVNYFCIALQMDCRVAASWKVVSWLSPGIWEGGGFKPGAAA